MNLDLTDEEADALTKHRRRTLDYDPYPLITKQPTPLKPGP